jgi:hypothetical protein
VFGEITANSYVLDTKAGSSIFAGVVLMLFALSMLIMAGYKTYRFCIKYTLKDYLLERKRRKYLKEAAVEMDDLHDPEVIAR